MAKKKKQPRRKDTLFFKKGKLQLSNLIGVLLIVAMVIVAGFQLYTNKSVFNTPLVSNSDPTVKQHQKFIKTIAPYAQQMQRQYGVLASITMAQAILESDWGQSELSKKYNNYYGIKGSANVPSEYLKTQEFVNGSWQTVSASFRVYDSWQASMRDHSLLLVNGTDWNSGQYTAVLQATNYQTAAQALYNAGYATDPNYPQKLIKLIQQYNLNKYDK